MENTPLVSVLICTYNRSTVLKRAIASVLAQDFTDYELIIIDDCSSDDTPNVIKAIEDPRIRYIRNESNLGSLQGDRAHVRRFIHELMRGKYFVYLCDDDYWLSNTLLSRQIKAFKLYDNLAMVIGGQLSFQITSTEDCQSLKNINGITQFDYNHLYTKAHPPQPFFIKRLYAKSVMNSEEFLSIFSQDPITRNMIVGATLFSKEHFIKSGAISSKYGSKWQAGYEFLMGPSCYGGVVYLDQPEIVVEVRPANASFQGTQLGHYQDSLMSVNDAFKLSLAHPTKRKKRNFFRKIKKGTIRNISRSFLRNTISGKLYDHLTICGDKNITESVQAMQVIKIYIKNSIVPWGKDLKYFLLAGLPKKTLQKINDSKLCRLVKF